MYTSNTWKFFLKRGFPPLFLKSINRETGKKGKKPELDGAKKLATHF